MPCSTRSITSGMGILRWPFATLTLTATTVPTAGGACASAAGPGPVAAAFAIGEDGSFAAAPSGVAPALALVVSPLANATGSIDITVPAGAVADAGGTANTLAATAQQAYNTAVAVAKTTIVSFDEATPPVLTGFGGSEDATVVVDPTNAANKVGKIVKAANAESWAGATVSICPGDAVVKLPFSDANKTMSARVWSPDAGIPVRLKVEDAADNTKTVETEAMTTAAGAWQTLTFNFANPVAGTAALNLANTYNKSSIFFNFGKTGAEVGAAKTYYMDDLSFVGSTFAVACPGGGGGGSGGTALVTFDDPALTYKLTDFGGTTSSIVTDPAGGTGKVAQVVKTIAAELWAGTTMSTGANDSIATVPFTDSAKTMTMRVHAPAAGLPIRLKLEDAADNTHTVETEAITTAAGWQTLTFNFANQVPGTAALNLAFTYNKSSVFPNFGKTGAQIGADSTYFFDDLTFVPAAAGGGGGTPPSGLINLVGGVYASNYAETPTPWKSVEGGNAGRYIDTSVATQDWWSGLAANDATPSFYFGYGINSGAKPWGFGGYVSAPNNGVANVAPYSSLQIAVWGNDQLVNTKPNFTVIMKGPEVAGCTSELKGNIAVTGAGVQTYTLPLNGFTLQTACAYASAAAALAAGVKEIHIQVLGNNVQYVSGQDAANNYPNGLNIGPIKFK